MKSKRLNFPLIKAVILAAIIGLTVPWSVYAHAFIDHAEPAVGSTVKDSPTEVHLLFTMSVQASLSGLRVLDATGKQVDKKDLHADPKDPRSLRVSLPAALGAGTYKVEWHAVSMDGHTTQGDFIFRVGP